MRKLLIGILGAAVLAVAPAHAQTYNLTLAGASPGGLWSRIGLGLDKAIAKAYPGSTVTYQTGSGGIANAKLVQDKNKSCATITARDWPSGNLRRKIYSCPRR